MSETSSRISLTLHDLTNRNCQKILHFVRVVLQSLDQCSGNTSCATESSRTAGTGRGSFIFLVFFVFNRRTGTHGSLFFLFSFLSIVIFPLIQLGLCESSNVDGCETTVLEHVLEKRNSSCPLLLLLTSTDGRMHHRPRTKRMNEQNPPLGAYRTFSYPQCKIY